MNKNKKKGFTLFEIIAALAIVAIFSGFVITSLSAIPQIKMKSTAQKIKSEFELTRNFAKTHGGETQFILKKVEDGVEIVRSGKNIKEEITHIKDYDLAIYYELTEVEGEWVLGSEEGPGVEEASLCMEFAQTDGAVIGPNMVNYITLSNGSKDYTFYIEHLSGMIYYDYELDKEEIDKNVLNEAEATVLLPLFLEKGAYATTITLNGTGEAIQPELAYDSRHVKIGGVYRAIDPGTYTITFSLKNPYASKWEDGTRTDKTLTWTIN